MMNSENIKDAKIILKNFTRTTSSHGIPQIGYSRGIKGRLFWAVVFCFGVSIFSNQAMSLIRKYLRGDKTVNVELRFASAPFPAVTICNLNPYKNSLVQEIDEIKRTLNVFDHVKKSSKGHPATEAPSASSTVSPPASVPSSGSSSRPRSSASTRTASPKPMATPAPRRSTRDIRYQPIMAFCNCGNINNECAPITKPKGPFGSRCVCFRDLEYKTLEACFNEKMWTTLVCYECSYTGRCAHPSSRMDDERVRGRYCMCPATASFCVIKPAVIPTIGDPMWFTTTTTTSTTTTTPTTSTSTATTTTTTTTPTTTTTTTTPTTTSTTTTSTTTMYTGPTTMDYKEVQALGYEDMTDEVAIVTKAKENLVFIIATLDLETRVNLSHTKNEFIRMCSFNGKQCDIENDFSMHVDPTYGNCFTFNFEENTNRTSSRAGPMYGLRVLVYSNVSDYMATTEAAGVRIQIHGHNDQPFPDTFGQNAPTGFISSFGIKLKEIKRSPKFGDCAMDGRTDKYIYYNRTYSTEGCYRSCFQHLTLEKCKCGDPRFPIPPNAAFCRAGDGKARKCLNDLIEEVGGFHGVQDCTCRQPCKQEGYSVSYSAARWPADYYQMGDCEEENDTRRCVDEYRQNAALLEIYYEQLNFESLDELEAYGLVNLVADFGGQLGLWLGFSVITCIEIVMLLVDLVMLMCGHRAKQILWSHHDHQTTPDASSMMGGGGGDQKSSVEVGVSGEHAWMLEGQKDLTMPIKRATTRNGEYCSCHKETDETELPRKAVAEDL